MSKLIDDKTTKDVAGLIKIKIADEEIPNYTQQLNTVLDSVTVLSEMKTDDVAETSQTHGLKNVLRKDEVEPGLDLTKYKNTKNYKKPYFTVKKVI